MFLFSAGECRVVRPLPLDVGLSEDALVGGPARGDAPSEPEDRVDAPLGLDAEVQPARRPFVIRFVPAVLTSTCLVDRFVSDSGSRPPACRPVPVPGIHRVPDPGGLPMGVDLRHTGADGNGPARGEAGRPWRVRLLCW